MKITPQSERTYTYKNNFCITKELNKVKENGNKTVSAYNIIKKNGEFIQYKIGETLIRDI